MRSFRSKPVGWQHDNYRHYLAAKYGSAGRSKYFAKEKLVPVRIVDKAGDKYEFKTVAELRDLKAAAPGVYVKELTDEEVGEAIDKGYMARKKQYMAGMHADVTLVGDKLIVTPSPIFSDKMKEIPVTAEEKERFKEWKAGKSVQEAFPHWSPAKREMLLTGMDDAEFKKYVGGDEKEYMALKVREEDGVYDPDILDVRQQAMLERADVRAKGDVVGLFTPQQRISMGETDTDFIDRDLLRRLVVERRQKYLCSKEVKQQNRELLKKWGMPANAEVYVEKKTGKVVAAYDQKKGVGEAVKNEVLERANKEGIVKVNPAKNKYYSVMRGLLDDIPGDEEKEMFKSRREAALREKCHVMLEDAEAKGDIRPHVSQNFMEREFAREREHFRNGTYDYNQFENEVMHKLKRDMQTHSTKLKLFS